MRYKVIKPLVIIQSAETRADWYGYDGAIVPEKLNDERCKQLLKEGFLEKYEEPEPAVGDDEASDKVADVLAAVGDDKAKAAKAIETEKAGKNRPTLISGLQAVIDA